MRLILLASIITLASCGSPGVNESIDDRNGSGEETSEQSPSAPQATAEQSRHSSQGPVDAPLGVEYVGRWNGPEGTFLVVTDPPRGGMTLTFVVNGEDRQYSGSVTADGLRFMRDGTAETAILVPGSDAEKRACLSLREGESYCRS